MVSEVASSNEETRTVTTQEYRLLFNTLSESIQDMERIVARLKNAQIAAEELCIDEPIPKEPLIFIPQPNIRAVK